MGYIVYILRFNQLPTHFGKAPKEARRLVCTNNTPKGF